MSYDGPPSRFLPDAVARLPRPDVALPNGMRRLAASTLLLISLALGGCKRARDAAARLASSDGDVGDTTLHFGPLDTAILTNGSGWVRREPGVAPDLPPQQLRAPAMADSAFTPADSTSQEPLAPPTRRSDADSATRAGRGRRDTLTDTLAPRRQRRDSTQPDRGSARPDTTVPDSTS